MTLPTSACLYVHTTAPLWRINLHHGSVPVAAAVLKHFVWVALLNHVQHGSAKHSVNGGLAFLWEMRFSTPYSSAPNEPIKMAFGTRDYVVEATPPANFCPPTLYRLPPGKG